ncbi:MAG: outer membrane beta-barrel domain-containing protein [Bdellovibrionales bacterium]|nr:outer membrane beta-barrel domain-containing protein [Bdellovibrionales bacterium]
MQNLLLALLLLVSLPTFAETIEFSEDELATETVLPVFDKTQVVKNRTISVSKRFELGAGAGVNMTEALYNNLILNISGAYHFDEIHGINVNATLTGSGLSAMGENLAQGIGMQASGRKLDASRAPSVKYLVLGNYQLTAYYGKISVSKQTTMNLSLYGLAGMGLVGFDDTTNLAMSFGFGQKVYFTKELALRLDMRLITYQGPDVTTTTDNLEPGGPKLTSDDLSSTNFFHTHLTLGLVYLL